jgi:hypothetical protein
MKIKNFKCLLITMPIVWYYLGTMDKKYVREISFTSGLLVSQKYKKYPAWDNYIEPILIKQFSILDCAAHSFIKGMISDNDDKKLVNLVFDELKNDVKNDLFDENNNRE